jgi:hypothetical protein
MIGLTPQQKKHFDTLISFLTIFLLGLFALIVTLFLLMEISGTPKQMVIEPESVQKGNYISEKDIAIEKNMLPIFEEFPDDYATSTPSLNETFDTVARPISEAEYRKKVSPDQTIQYPFDYALTKEFDSLQVDSPTTVLNNPSLVYVDPSSGISVESVFVEYGSVNKGDVPTMQSRQGIIFQIDRQNNQILLSSITDGTQRIFVKPTTRFYINGKDITLANLTETDVVYVEGLGYNGVSEITATSITIKGRFEIITKTDS